MNAVDFPSVGLAEALKRLSEMPAFLHAAVVRATPDELRARPEPEKFSLVEHACHLRDLEREGYGVRLRRMLLEDHPTLQGFEGDVIARQRDYLGQDALNAAAEFALARNAFVARIDCLTPAEMRRTASFAGRAISICDLLAMMVEHDSEHMREIAALVGRDDRG